MTFHFSYIKIYLFLIFAFIFSNLYSQTKRIKFQRISFEQGLSESYVKSIIQDKKGFIWFATLDGLNKYDGYKIRIYRNKVHDSTSISDNDVNILYESDGILWAGTNNQGICRYDALRDKFHTYKTNAGLTNNKITAISGKNEILWVGTANGLNKLNTQTGKIQNFKHSETENSLLSNKITALLQISDEILWIGTDKGLSQFNFKTEKFTHFIISEITTLFLDKENFLWVGTKQGLAKLDSQKNSFTNFRNDLKNAETIANNWVTGIIEDAEGFIWVSTNGGGLNKLDKKTGLFQRFETDPSDETGLKTNNILTLYQDATSILWVGTAYKGVYKWNRAAENLDLFRHNPYVTWSLSSDQVRTIYEDREGTIWIGTVEGGLNQWNKNENKFIHYKHSNSDATTLSHNHIRAIFEDSKGNFWVGTHEGGLNKLDKKTGKAKRYLADGKLNSISHNSVWKIYEDKKQNLWICTNGGGLNLFDYKTETFSAFRTDSTSKTSISDDRVTTVFQDSKGILWVGTFGGGLNAFDYEKKTFTHYKNDKNNPKSISDNRIYCIMEDKNDTLWIGTKGGLNKFDRNSQTFSHYTEENDFPNNVMMGILEDEQGCLWVSTNNGLARFNKKTGKVRSYSVRDGLQSNEFLVGSYCRAKNGEMFFGGVDGFNVFYPSKIKENTNKPLVVITGFQISNEFVEFDTVIAEKKHIELEYWQRDLSFDFVALDYIFSEKNQYKYKLEGYDKKWTFAKNRRAASYTNLPPGNYVFKVIGSNNDEVWNDKATEIKIVIVPAIWQRKWFIPALVGLGVLIIISVLLLRMKRIREQNEKLEKLVQIRTAEVVKQKEEIEVHLKAIELKNVEIEKKNEVLEEQKSLIQAHLTEIEAKNIELAHQKKEIIDSIHYARRIQTATLRNPLANRDVEHFVLFRPKDIVSGDFYWISEKDNRLIIVAADCTGHGVPGAFMSMLGVSLLNKIVNEEGITQPSEILNWLRDNITVLLGQTGKENEPRDGMDIALCAIDKGNGTIEFAGANNPLYYLRPAANAIEIIEADGMPIAFYDVMDPFKNHVINYEKGDQFYIFSDGYADQFGGEKGKKFMSKRMRELIVNIREQQMPDQRNSLVQAFENWKGDLEQVDDVVVIGIRM